MRFTPPFGHSRRAVISVLGITQILAWGSSYYLPAVLAKPIAVDTGWSLSFVVAGLSIALLIAGIASPIVGKYIQRYGGGPILASSSVLLAFGLAVMGAASNPTMFIVAWLIVGAGMAGGLYDAGFATLGRLYGKGARSAITNLTLFGGFASTLCWPLSAYLVEHYGWRMACFTYAAIHLLLCLPLHLSIFPRSETMEPRVATQAELPSTTSPPGAFWILAAILILASLISSTLSVHMLTVLQLRGVDLIAAVSLGALIGPAQVSARIAEMATGQRHHPIWTMLASAVLLAIGVGLLWSSFPITAVALFIYGAGNGIFSIAKGTVPLAFFEQHEYAVNMGRLAMPSLIIQALAPSLGAILLESGTSNALLITLIAFAVVNVSLVILLVVRVRRIRHAPS